MPDSRVGAEKISDEFRVSHNDKNKEMLKKQRGMLKEHNSTPGKTQWSKLAFDYNPEYKIKMHESSTDNN